MDLLNTVGIPFFPYQSQGTPPSITNKGEQILDGMILTQYRRSTNLKEYMMCFISELDELFYQVSEVYNGRLIRNAVGRQLDIIGIILQQDRSVILPTLWFGFYGAPEALGFGTLPDPKVGGIFRSIHQEDYVHTPLSDEVYRRVLIAKAFATNSPYAGLDLAYGVVSELLGRVPSTFNFVESQSAAELQLTTDQITNVDLQLIYYMSKYFVPAGITFTITQVL